MAKYPDLKSYLQVNYIGLRSKRFRSMSRSGLLKEPWILIRPLLLIKRGMIVYMAAIANSLSLLIQANIYIGYAVCINDPKYVSVDLVGSKAELKLTSYAREHAGCLIFLYKSTSYLREMQDKYEKRDR